MGYLYEGYWFRTQSLLFGNPTNPSMAVLGPRWLYEAEHWKIEPTKEYNDLLYLGFIGTVIKIVKYHTYPEQTISFRITPVTNLGWWKQKSFIKHFFRNMLWFCDYI